MKKFSKILLLLLSLIAIATAFTVVALADGEEELTPVLVESLDFTTKPGTDTVLNDGDPIKTSTSKRGEWVAGAADNGNIYLVGQKNSLTSGDGNQYERTYTGALSGTKAYVLSNYPTLAVDFDVMSTSNSFASATSITTYFYKGTTSTSVANTGSIKLSDVFKPTANQWHHVTYILSSDSVGKLTINFYVDGVSKYTKTVDKSSALSSVMSTARAGSTRLYGIYSGSNKICFDNFKYTYYPASYGDATTGFDKIASYHYNDSYEMPYGTTVAKIGDTVYDNVEKAIAAAGENDVVSLLADVKESVVIGKAVKVDTNKYAADGSIEGSYAFPYTATDGYQESILGGIYTFAKAANTVIVNWDPACADGCDCFAEYGGHRLTATGEVALGETPFYEGALPTYAVIDGATKRFVGWSYENDGTADVLTAVTEAQVEAKVLNIYPVYENVQYAFEILRNGESTYGFNGDFDSMVAAAKTGSTIILHDDVTMYHSIMVKDKNMTLTLDLNGHSLNRHYVKVTEYEATTDENGEYVKGEKIGTVTEGYDTEHVVKYSSGALVYANAVFGIGVTKTDYKVNITLTSSKPGANVYAIAYSADRLYVDGEAVKTENLEVTDGLKFFDLNPAKGVNINLDTANVNIYSGTLFSGEHGGNNLDVPQETIKINGGNFYSIGSIADGAFALKNGEIVTVKNASFYSNGNRITMNDSSSRDRNTRINFVNCNIYDASFFSRYVNDIYTLTDCRLVNPSYSSKQTVIFEEGTLATDTSLKITAKPGYILAPGSDKTYSYVNIASVVPTLDASGKVTASFVYTDAISGTYAYEMKSALTVEDRITDANISMLYYSNFVLAFYLPAKAGYDYTSVSLTKSENTVFINGEEYYVYTKSLTTAGAANDLTVNVCFTRNDAKYIQSFNISALVYAEIVLGAPVNEAEKVSVSDMVRFIKEARLLAGLEISEKLAKIEAMENYLPSEYKESAEYDDLGADYSNLVGVALGFAVRGSNASYAITLPEEGFTGATVKATFENGTEATLKNSGSVWYTTNSMHVSELISQRIFIEITVPAAEEGGEATVISGSYSLGAYIQAMEEVTFAKAMYQFAESAKAYREYLETL